MYDFSWFGLLRVRYNAKSIFRTSCTAVVSILLLRLTIVSVVLGCLVRWCLFFSQARALGNS